MLKTSRRGLLTGAAALAAYSVLPRNAAKAMRDFEAPANPFTIYGANLAAWWRAQDYWLMTDDGAGLVSNWKDRVGSLAVTATTTARATWGATSFNSAYPGLTFDGAANCYVTTSLSTLPTGATAGEIWAVGKATTTATALYACVYGNGNAAGTFRSAIKSTTDTGRLNDGTSSSTDSGPNLLTSPFILCTQWSGTTANGFTNGTAFSGNPVTIGSLNTSTTRLRIGAFNTTAAAFFWNGVISDIIITSAVGSTSQRQKMEGFLAWRYGLQTAGGAFLPSGHPYAFGRPPA